MAFLIGWQLWQRAGAWIFTLLVVGHPALLMNGRRVMLEGALLFFGLFVLWLGLVISGRIAKGRGGGALAWGGVAVAGGFAMASKHSGFLFVAATGAMIVLALVRSWRGSGRFPMGSTMALGASMAGVLGGFILLTPGIWQDPFARLVDLLRIRAELVDANDDGAHSGLIPQLWRLFYMPFAAPPQYFEVWEWSLTPGLWDSIRNYQASHLAGLPLNGVVGWVVTAGALGAVAWSLVRREFDGLRLALGATVVAVLVYANPLPWQRYYLPLIPFYAGLFVVGFREGWRTFRVVLRT